MEIYIYIIGISDNSPLELSGRWVLPGVRKLGDIFDMTNCLGQGDFD